MKLVQRHQSGKGMYRLLFEAEEDHLARFQKPGQFAVLTVSSEVAGYFAMASLPGKNPVEFLVKESDSARPLLELKEGDQSVQMQKILGDGFDLSELSPERSVHLFSMGSGIAPLRSLILYLAARQVETGPVTLWQGSFTKEHLPYSDEYENWKQSGIRVIPCLDEDESLKKNVIESFRESGESLENAVAYWIGSPAFGEAVSHMVKEHGMKQKYLYTNH